MTGPAPTLSPSSAGHLPVNGLDLYHEVYGELGTSPPLLLLPGAFMATGSMAAWVAGFAADRTVVVADMQGQGRTPDAPRALSYEQFADDAAALLRGLGVDRADVLGYSQGGGVALQLALRHPDLVGKLVVMAATFRRDGWYPAVHSAVTGMDVTVLSGTPVETAFLEHTPDPAAFAAWVEKVKVLNAEDQQIDDARMRGITARSMVIVGDADGVRPEHAVEMFRLLGGGNERAAATGMLQEVPRARLVVLPATSHIGLVGETATLVPAISAFLDDAVAPTPTLF
ncbi:Menaquinone biosynthesis related protein MenX [Pseudonocardia sp. Ae406_Ps2]|uniref:alpha/beta fold hydrolase n=1 Tax=unclassified Pseudonocardia TaxID=2619320 RepID=UPI00094AB421|nr:MULTISPECIES: alpha/beta hydrolase [unclassified Pseudonocardia]OLM00376.1 Menaquinone biosynthesis related protein MenX [Pseudonocardia sp. Ae406_Ps2]OLM07833.1 Menaquinone biosynthesis related protein MenX [Pseudonocardia sp. Ae331_Ps2]OLM21946.1 Menaquinone biosynthesis related protein MenX [Pseudonocardia sp. Ae706_Ps2]OLM31034.1 Menaquinone biosynthesis related protein MenX [Pseudonocardia sp. Ae717_Ps2]